MASNNTTPTPTSNGDEIVYPNDNDVLCGKSKACVNHIGSRRYREYIDSYRERYAEATTKYQKMVITKEIYNNLINQSFRFLKFNKSTGSWEEISPHIARDKIGHALRFANYAANAVAAMNGSSNASIGGGSTRSMPLPSNTRSEEQIPLSSSSRNQQPHLSIEYQAPFYRPPQQQPGRHHNDTNYIRERRHSIEYHGRQYEQQQPGRHSNNHNHVRATDPHHQHHHLAHQQRRQSMEYEAAQYAQYVQKQTPTTAQLQTTAAAPQFPGQQQQYPGGCEAPTSNVLPGAYHRGGRIMHAPPYQPPTDHASTVRRAHIWSAGGADDDDHDHGNPSQHQHHQPLGKRPRSSDDPPVSSDQTLEAQDDGGGQHQHYHHHQANKRVKPTRPAAATTTGAGQIMAATAAARSESGLRRMNSISPDANEDEPQEPMLPQQQQQQADNKPRRPADSSVHAVSRGGDSPESQVCLLSDLETTYGRVAEAASTKKKPLDPLGRRNDMARTTRATSPESQARQLSNLEVEITYGRVTKVPSMKKPSNPITSSSTGRSGEEPVTVGTDDSEGAYDSDRILPSFTRKSQGGGSFQISPVRVAAGSDGELPLPRSSSKSNNNAPRNVAGAMGRTGPNRESLEDIDTMMQGPVMEWEQNFDAASLFSPETESGVEAESSPSPQQQEAFFRNT